MPLLAAIPAITAITAGLGAAGGIAKNAAQEKKAEQERQLAATTQRYSPWTGLKAGPISTPDPVGDIASGIAGGAGLGQSLAKGIAAPTQDADMLDAQKNGLGNGSKFADYYNSR